MYKVFVKDIPIILSTEENIGDQYTAIPLKKVKFKKLIDEINNGSLTHVNLFHKNVEAIEKFLRKKLKLREAAGGLVFNKKGDILFIRRNGKWDLPKGHIDKGETHEAAAIREVMEETGVQGLEVKRYIKKTYHVFKRNDKYKLKATYWYEMYTEFDGELVPEIGEGIKKAKWKNLKKSRKALHNSYENIKTLFPSAYLPSNPNDGIPHV